MKKLTTYALILAMASLGFTACEPNEEVNESKYADRSYGNEAVAACDALITYIPRSIDTALFFVVMNRKLLLACR